jgi:molybdopterin-containing oxidoreductase family iron-sulfur binding subunit
MDTHDPHALPDLPGLSPSRRGFLKLVGFSWAAAVLPGCGREPDYEAIPFATKPETVTPGLAQWYATTCTGCSAGCGVLAKVRDGRPIKIEGNGAHPLSSGRTCAVGQASILDLYDSKRLTDPLTGGKPSSWETVDAAVGTALTRVNHLGGRVRILTGTLNGPTIRGQIRRFLEKYPGSSHVMVDADSHAAEMDAQAQLRGRSLLPRYRFQHAQALVSVAADFLGTWLSPVEFTRAYQHARRLGTGQPFCHHTHFEARVSLTGGNADRRIRAHPDQMPLVLAGLAARVTKALGLPKPWASVPPSGLDETLIDDAAKRLLAAPRGHALVVCGLDDAAAQRITAYLNNILGADDERIADRTVDLVWTSQQALGSDRGVDALRREMEAGAVDALIVAGCNPVYDRADGEAFAAAMAKVPLVVCVSDRLDETAAVAHHVCPPPDGLATWSDAEPILGRLTVGQPAIRPLGNTRPLLESLATWMGAPVSAYDAMRRTWREELYPRAGVDVPFEQWWAESVHAGFATIQPRVEALQPLRLEALGEVPKPTQAAGLAVVLYPKVGLRNSRHAHNPWLQELPDPISKVSWGNYAVLGPATAARLDLADGRLVRLGEGDKRIELPVLVQTGQAEDTVAIAVGYGVQGTDRFTSIGPEWMQGEATVEPGGTVGVRASGLRGQRMEVITPLYKRRELARTQIYDRLEVPAHLAPEGERTRPCIEETTLGEYRIDPRAGAHHAHPAAELWDQDHTYKGRHWGLAIDLAACTGCSACVVACQSENNIPVVGMDEVRRQREMHWLRIDRYFQGTDDDLQVVHQPMMCQQCDHAPCETVCPVLATVHGEEGLNQQVYNRCVGTRYCSNNCPYKVRRFNWFEYRHEDELQNLVLNPDVTVRTRGVMEKCTFCVQRIQEKKAEAKRDGRELMDGEIQPACMQVCPAGAVVFGDTNDGESSVSQWGHSPRAYRVLEELNVKPSVAYLRRVQDRPASENGDRHE